MMSLHKWFIKIFKIKEKLSQPIKKIQINKNKDLTEFSFRYKLKNKTNKQIYPNNLHKKINNIHLEITNESSNSIFGKQKSLSKQKSFNIFSKLETKSLKSNRKKSFEYCKNLYYCNSNTRKNISNLNHNISLFNKNLYKTNDYTKIINKQNNDVSNNSYSIELINNSAINFTDSKRKQRWVYTYHIKPNIEKEDLLYKIKQKKVLLTNRQRKKLFDDLYNDNLLRKNKLNKLFESKENSYNDIYTFQPNVIKNKIFSQNFNANYSINNEIIPDFLMRMIEYERIKKYNLNKIKKEMYDSNRKRSSMPKININNSHLLKLSNSFNKLKKEKINKISNDIMKEQGITFYPKTNLNYNKKIKNNIYIRNKQYEKIKEQNKYYKTIISNREKECTFKPKINYNRNNNILKIKTNVSDILNCRHQKYIDKLD